MPWLLPFSKTYEYVSALERKESGKLFQFLLDTLLLGHRLSEQCCRNNAGLRPSSCGDEKFIRQLVWVYWDNLLQRVQSLCKNNILECLHQCIALLPKSYN